MAPPMCRRRSNAALRFATSESGAVTADWVVITAGIVGLGLATTTAVRMGVTSLGGDVSASLSNASVADLGCLGGTGADQWACYSGPTITASMWGWGYVSTPMCAYSPGGEIACASPVSSMTQMYQMSNGEYYYHNTTTRDGETTETWTNSRGEEVEAPPPMSV